MKLLSEISKINDLFFFINEKREVAFIPLVPTFPQANSFHREKKRARKMVPQRISGDDPRLTYVGNREPMVLH